MFVNNNNFKIGEIPHLNPLTQKAERLAWWREQKRRCMEGYWSAGKWCPGELYHYINFWHIEIGDVKRGNQGKIKGLPFFRDLEWDKFLVATEAFGFSGFAGDLRNTCNELYAPENIKDSIETEEITKEQAEKYNYIPVREYLRMNHFTNLGKPLYHNNAKNVIDVEARGGGKSFTAASLIAHNFLFDGSHDYDRYMELKKAGTPMVSQTLVGAIQAMYSGDLLKKFKYGFDGYAGKFKFYDEEFPCPFMVDTVGGLDPGDVPMVSKKSGSQLHHRTFADRAFAANGTRPGKAFLEEIGFFHRLIAALGAMKDLTYDGNRKFGTIWMFGTGGDMEGGSTLAAQEVFYNPESYDCVMFEDQWEARGKIGYFVPAEMAINQYKEGPNMVTNYDKVDKYLTKSRDKAKKASSPKPYNDELQNRPRKPSEAFLAIHENKFPIKLLEDAFVKMTSKESELGSHWTGFAELKTDDNDTVSLQWVNHDAIPVRTWPVKSGIDVEGCVEIFEMPRRHRDGSTIDSRYIASTDPVDDDDIEGSLQSTLIFDMFTERIVAEYTARTYQVEDYWENTRLLLMFYGAVCNYENNKKGFYGHMKNTHSLHLLCDTPSILRDLDLAIIKDEGNKSKGTYASNTVNEYGRKLYNIWLKKEAIDREGLKNAQCIRSLGLIQETTNYNPKGNFDRISACEKLFILLADRQHLMDGADRSDINEAAAGLAADPYFNKNYERWMKKNGRGSLVGMNRELKRA